MMPDLLYGEFLPSATPLIFVDYLHTCLYLRSMPMHLIARVRHA
jgi:hypothetical protein